MKEMETRYEVNGREGKEQRRKKITNKKLRLQSLSLQSARLDKDQEQDTEKDKDGKGWTCE